jgi:hypothetical protein
MKVIFRRAAVAIAAIFTTSAVLLGPIGTAPAQAASGNDFCENFSGIWCLNDWSNGGSGNSVKTYASGASNESFLEQDTGRCGGYVNGSCPFTNTTFDQRYAGYPIVQLEYQPKGLCIAADTSNTLAVLGKCNNLGSGSGGSTGTLFVDHNGYMISVYYSNVDDYGNEASCIYGEPFAGGEVTLNLETTEGCPIWGLYIP